MNDPEAQSDHSMDLDLAATMGFGSFGGKPQQSKKRKLEDFTGANAQALGHRPQPQTINTIQDETNVSVARAELQAVFIQADTSIGSGAPLPIKPEMEDPNDYTTWDLPSLARGRPNEDGDLVIFKPSFVADPWQRKSTALST